MKTHHRRIGAMVAAAEAGVPWVISGYAVDLKRYPDFWQVRFITRHFSTPMVGGLRVVTKSQRNRMFDKFYGQAAFKRLIKAFVLSGYDRMLTPSLDHIKPRKLGGKHIVSNFQFLSLRDNIAKGVLSDAVWRQRKKITKKRPMTGKRAKTRENKIASDFARLMRDLGFGKMI